MFIVYLIFQPHHTKHFNKSLFYPTFFYTFILFLHAEKCFFFVSQFLFLLSNQYFSYLLSQLLYNIILTYILFSFGFYSAFRWFYFHPNFMFQLVHSFYVLAFQEVNIFRFLRNEIKGRREMQYFENFPGSQQYIIYFKFSLQFLLGF